MIISAFYAYLLLAPPPRPTREENQLKEEEEVLLHVASVGAGGPVGRGPGEWMSLLVMITIDIERGEHPSTVFRMRVNLSRRSGSTYRRRYAPAYARVGAFRRSCVRAGT